MVFGIFKRKTKEKASVPTGHELDYSADELIVSRTDAGGRILYANQLFTKLSGYDEADLLGAPHSIVRHPDMPRYIFKLLWDRVSAGEEIFAYVVNMSRNGDHYWVLAHVTPTFNASGEIVGYHSNRRKPTPEALVVIKDLYKKMMDAEQAQSSKKLGMEAAKAVLDGALSQKGMVYDEFVLSI